LSDLKTKSLYIFESQDHHDLLCGAKLLKQSPDAHFAKIEAADHMPTLPYPNELDRLITHFLNESP
jgi:pimeloyl-ACP methyl ester carboxylesterase